MKRLILTISPLLLMLVWRRPYSASPNAVVLKSLHFLMPGMGLKGDNFPQKVLRKKQTRTEDNTEKRKIEFENKGHEK